LRLDDEKLSDANEQHGRETNEHVRPQPSPFSGGFTFPTNEPAERQRDKRLE
jgi:hypothetical protein